MKKIINHSLQIGLLALFLTFLSACGGSGSSNSNPNLAPRNISMSVNVLNSFGGAFGFASDISIKDTSGNILGSQSLPAFGTPATFPAISTNQTNLIIQAEAANHVTQRIVVSVPYNATTSTHSIRLLPVGTTSPVNFAAPLPSYTGLDGSNVSFSGGVFEDENGNVATNGFVDITPLDPFSNPASFPGDINISIGGAPGTMVSLGMVNFTFRDGSGNELNLIDGTTAVIEMPLYRAVDANGTPLNIGDVVPIWSMDDTTGQWTQETSGVVIAMGASPTGLGVQATVTHFSWWNTDFAVSCTQKNLEVVDLNGNVYPTDVWTLDANFTMEVAGSSTYYHGPTASRSATFNSSGDSICMPDGFAADLVASGNIGSAPVSKRLSLSSADIDAINTVQFVIDASTIESLVLTPDNVVFANSQITQQMSTQLYNLAPTDINWYVDGILGGDATVGTIDANGLYTKPSTATPSQVTIKAESINDSNVFDESTVILDTVTLEYLYDSIVHAMVPSLSTFSGLPNQSYDLAIQPINLVDRFANPVNIIEGNISALNIAWRVTQYDSGAEEIVTEPVTATAIDSNTVRLTQVDPNFTTNSSSEYYLEARYLGKTYQQLLAP